MRKITAKTRLFDMIHRGEKPYGSMVSSIDPAVTDVMGEVGIDFVIIDSEHARNGRVELENHVRAANSHGMIPISRVHENRPALVQGHLDSGAHAIIVPHVDTADDAFSAVQAALYQPAGRRSMCPACYAGSYALDDWAEYAALANANVMIIPIIESVKAVENIDEIFAVDGVDIVQFGPGDLSSDMGIPLRKDCPQMRAMWEKVYQAAAAAGKYVMAPPNLGFDEAHLVYDGLDFMMLRELVKTNFRKHQDAVARQSTAAPREPESVQ